MMGYGEQWGNARSGVEGKREITWLTNNTKSFKDQWS